MSAGLISCMFLPAIALGMYFDAPVTSKSFACFQNLSLLVLSLLFCGGRTRD